MARSSTLLMDRLCTKELVPERGGLAGPWRVGAEGRRVIKSPVDRLTAGAVLAWVRPLSSGEMSPVLLPSAKYAMAAST